MNNSIRHKLLTKSETKIGSDWTWAPKKHLESKGHSLCLGVCLGS